MSTSGRTARALVSPTCARVVVSVFAMVAAGCGGDSPTSPTGGGPTATVVTPRITWTAWAPDPASPFQFSPMLLTSLDVSVRDTSGRPGRIAGPHTQLADSTGALAVDTTVLLDSRLEPRGQVTVRVFVTTVPGLLTPPVGLLRVTIKVEDDDGSQRTATATVELR